jgi:hypothetical protein
MAAPHHSMPMASQVTEHERATFITQLYNLLQQIVQLSKGIVPDEALLLKVCSLPNAHCVVQLDPRAVSR